MAARHAVDADGYFDVRVTAQGPFDAPPRSCFLDGLQVATGATLGKRNLQWVQSDQIIVRVENTRTAKVVEVRPTAALMKLVAVVQPRPRSDTPPDDAPQANGAPKVGDRAEPSLETVARRIAAMPEREILVVTSPARK
ncbi:MAG: hypothetical protein A2V70_06450 [Planctomycetes bacterium RBG_13_63_9]|nr:MAG: hypothetical protein A2V70_06450 [Planctomycetes bacterium RBG_13_63_9]